MFASPQKLRVVTSEKQLTSLVPISRALFVLCPLICFGIPASWSTSPASWAITNYQLAFSKLNQTAFSSSEYPLTAEAVFSSPWSICLTRFFALAYTYHYLNWFSKPTVIPWHRMSSTRWAGIISVWIASIALYLYDYTAGFLLLLTLSFGHVVLEFPLNHLAFKQMLLGNRTAVSPVPPLRRSDARST